MCLRRRRDALERGGSRVAARRRCELTLQIEVALSTERSWHQLGTLVLSAIGARMRSLTHVRGFRHRSRHDFADRRVRHLLFAGSFGAGIFTFNRASPQIHVFDWRVISQQPSECSIRPEQKTTQLSWRRLTWKYRNLIFAFKYQSSHAAQKMPVDMAVNDPATRIVTDVSDQSPSRLR